MSTKPEAPDYDDAQGKLNAARSIIDCLAMLACTGPVPEHQPRATQH